ncbi:MAG TPA: ElyC/SanA/YdcF family protein [Candidatus Methylomirabilis sp.]|nr:ElyC/SanA/YdcF family protein [Candidatus Methylomirabilis sp.]
MSLLLPSTLVSAALIGGLLFLVARRTRRMGIALLVVGAALLAALGTGPVSFLILGSLEYRNPPLDVRRVPGPVLHIVVMAGYGETSVHQPLSSHVNAYTVSRLLETRRLYTQFPEATVVVSGHGEVPDIMRRVLVSQGIPLERVLIDDRSDSTRDSSRNLQDLIGPRPFLLVTSAGHMPRSLMAFRERGMTPIPAPTGYLTRKNILAVDYLPSVNNLIYADLAVKEYLGILWYLVTPAGGGTKDMP